MKTKRKLKITAALVLFFFSAQVFLVYAPAYARMDCWNDSARVGTDGGATAPVDAGKGDANPQGTEKIDDPVNVATGNFAYEHVDFSIPSRGLSLEFKRYYNNQGEYEGPFGSGWDHSYNIFLVESVEMVGSVVNSYVIRHNPNGSKDKFRAGVSNTYWSPKGVFDTLTKDAQGYAITTKHGVVYRFNAAGYLASITDRNANQITFTYDASTGVLAKITDSAGRDIVLAYTAEKKISSITDFSGRAWKYAYQNGDLTSVTAPATQDFPYGTIMTYAYSGHNLQSITDPRNNTFLDIAYDSHDRVQQMKSGAGYYRYTYYHAGVNYSSESPAYTLYRARFPKNSTISQDPKGNTVYYYLNNDGTTDRKVQSDSGKYFITQYKYNSDKLVTKATYPKGKAVLYEYDGRGNLLKTTRKPAPASAEADIVTTFTYETNFNFIKTVTDPLGRVTNYSYDVKGNLTQIAYPQVSGQAPQVNFTYNSFGQPLTSVDPGGSTTAYEYAPDTGYLTKLTRAAGTFNLDTEMSYDAVGNLIGIKDPMGNSTRFEYNSRNNVVKTISPAPFNYIARFKYDANDNLIQLDRQADADGSSWQSVYYTYDVMDRLETIKDAGGNITAYTYDLNGNRSSVTDALYNRTTYEYDGRNMLSLVYDADGRLTQYTYDDNGNLKEIKDANNNATTYTYDGFDRLVKTTYADGSSEEYTYDANSNLIAKKDAKGQVIYYDYDTLNRISEKGLSPKGTVPASVITYAYDLGSRLKEVTDTNGKITYTYDAADRITQVTYPSSKTVAYAYDANSNRTKLAYPDSTYITYTYDALSHLTAIKNQAGAAVATYQYDALSRRTGLNYANNTGASYEYDNINRLTKIKGLSPQGTVPDFSYTYDKVGNRLSMATASGTHNYTYDFLYQLKKADYPEGYFAADQTFSYDYLGNRKSVLDSATTDYTSNNLNQYTNVGETSYSYDATGNLTSDGTFTYAYDYENRLISANKTGTSAAYKYDPFGRRTEKTVGIVTTKYLYDGDQLICEYDNSGNLTAKYIYGPGIDEPISITKGGQTYYYNSDGLGSVISFTDSSGSTAESYSYDAFGKPSTTSAIGNRFMFTGREYDAETALYCYRERQYSPELGRFLQTDPLEIDDENTYTYCYNDPVNYSDPYGLLSLPLPIPLPIAGGGGIPLGDDPHLDGGWIDKPNPGDNPLDKPQQKPTVSTPQQGISENVTQGYADTGDAGKGGEKGDTNKGENKKPKPPKPKPPKPPDGLVEHPERKDKWGVIDELENFIEKWRFDRGKRGRPGWGGKDHLHFNGENKHYPPDTPYPY